MIKAEKLKQAYTVVTMGVAIFAMFFGAGNMVFPLNLGRSINDNLSIMIIAFIISGVCIPLVGLIALLRVKGDYWKFFSPLSKPVSIFIVSFIIMIIGPLFAAPRTEIVTYATLKNVPYLSSINNVDFSLLYFLTVYVLNFKPGNCVEIIGKVIGPIKVGCFVLLIILGVQLSNHGFVPSVSAHNSVSDALSIGYNTMDLLGAIFYASVVYATIKRGVKAGGDDANLIKLAIRAAILGEVLLAIIYAGLILLGYSFSAQLAGLPTEALIAGISDIVFGEFGTFFVSVCTSFACIATASALVEVSVDYFSHLFGKYKLSRNVYLLFILSIMFAMSQIGFAGIIKISSPVLSVLYPFLVLYAVFSFFHLDRLASRLIKKLSAKKLEMGILLD